MLLFKLRTNGTTESWEFILRRFNRQSIEELMFLEKNSGLNLKQDTKLLSI